MAGYIHAHSVAAQQLDNSSTVSVRFVYEAGDPMSYAAVEIFSPRESNIPFQTGRTDKNGTFSFIPDAEGMWLVSADDGDDHGSTPSFIVRRENDRFVTQKRELQ
jgi:nickel transport protein